ncbi:hypothetical protein SAMN05421846_108112 [Chryseobacterium taeanense]|uniref:YD repeat-containing protein n=1 Tax=Chryseobacterium taeanense TaxID=311334 RepID=A0A1G8KY38_9FLAO|nr:hypothetical protein [Chryseobacterium taeanense]SDI48299.1 hypothetical protein SAMN05421846_108112 [Chryseobacterium taeanense]
MKKNYLLFSLCAIISCGTADRDTSEFDNPVLVTKMVQDGDNFIFSYDGAKITEMKNTTENWTRVYTYTGDLITKYVDTYSDGTVDTTILTYNSNQKITKQTQTSSDSPNSSSTTTYIYIEGDKIKITQTFVSPGNTKTYVRDSYTNSDGSLKNWTETVTDVYPTVTYTGTGSLQNIVYDGGHYPFKNVTGFIKMLESEDMNGSARNLKEYKNIITYSNGGEESTIFKSTYEYNNKSYPTKAIRDYYHSNNQPYKSEITTYEYNHL